MKTIHRRPPVQKALACLALTALGCGPPQAGTDMRVFRAMNQLHTAVASRRVDLVDRSMEQIDRLQSEGAISPAARHSLDRIAGIARTGTWDAARTELRRFLRGQRRPPAP